MRKQENLTVDVGYSRNLVGAPLFDMRSERHIRAHGALAPPADLRVRATLRIERGNALKPLAGLLGQAGWGKGPESAYIVSIM